MSEWKKGDKGGKKAEAGSLIQKVTIEQLPNVKYCSASVNKTQKFLH